MNAQPSEKPAPRQTIAAVVASHVDAKDYPALTPQVLQLLYQVGVFVPNSLLELTGSLNAAYMLAHLIHLSRLKETVRRDGWSYWTRKQIKKQLKIGKDEQQAARKILRSLDLTEEKMVGLPRRLHLRINWEGLVRAIAQLAENRPTSWPDSDQLDGSESAGKVAEIRPTGWQETGQHSESTAESTAESSRRVKLEKGNGHPPKIEDDYHARLLKFKAECLARCRSDVTGQRSRDRRFPAALDILIERVEEKGTRVHSVEYFVKALAEFFESSSDLELLKRRLAQRGHGNRPGESQRALFGEE
jgi:hypothetical protein